MNSLDHQNEMTFLGKALDYLGTLQKPAPQWLDKIKQYGIQTKVPIIDDEMGYLLRMLCSLLKPERILEIGCGISYATHWMLLGSRKSQITALDYNKDRLDICGTYLKESGFDNQVTLICGWAKDFFLSNGQTFDLIFQDSTKKEYIHMIDDCRDSLNVGGLLVADNIFYNSKIFGLASGQEQKYSKGVQALKLFNETMAAHPDFECSFLPLSDGVLIAKRIC